MDSAVIQYVFAWYIKWRQRLNKPIVQCCITTFKGYYDPLPSLLKNVNI